MCDFCTKRVAGKSGGEQINSFSFLPSHPSLLVISAAVPEVGEPGNNGSPGSVKRVTS